MDDLVASGNQFCFATGIGEAITWLYRMAAAKMTALCNALCNETVVN